MFDLSNARITRLSLHFLDHDEDQSKLHLTDDIIPLSDPLVYNLINKYTISPFTNYEDFRRFEGIDKDVNTNTLCNYVRLLFEQQETFHETSKRIATHLFQSSVHHKIKSGDLFVTWMNDIAYGDELIDGVGIFKSEQKDDFLKLIYKDSDYNISADQGININKLDKGCIIYNTNAADGYVIATIDRTSRNMDARYWNDAFLKVTALDDAFHQTEQYLNMAQTYVSHKLAEDFDLKKGDQLGMLHETGQFFKKKDAYNENQFEQEVLGGNPDVIQSFQNYKRDYAMELQVDLPDQFAISNLAVKRSAKDFKSVLKLDKNFHVYIHGDRHMIEHGIDSDGRKFYKLYYEEES